MLRLKKKWFRWLPGLALLRSYQPWWLPRDIIAGLVLTTMLAPVGVAYAVASGVGPIYGLYATVACLLAYAVFGPSEALLALMRANPEARTTEIIQLNGRPRNSTVSSLKRLVKAGLIEHAGRGRWTVVDPDLLEAATPKPAGWIAPLSGKRVARHAVDGRVRDEMTLA